MRSFSSFGELAGFLEAFIVIFQIPAASHLDVVVVTNLNLVSVEDTPRHYPPRGLGTVNSGLSTRL